jgi:hypothetical protein
MNDSNQSDKKDMGQNIGSNLALNSGTLESALFFKKDKTIVFVHKKIERLVAAVYMLTNLFPDKEASKWALRDRGAKLLHCSVNLMHVSVMTKDSGEVRMGEVMLEMLSILKVASYAGLVSDMNLSILRSEFNDLLHRVNKVLGDREKESFRANESFFKQDGASSAELDGSRVGLVGGSNVKDKMNVFYGEDSITMDNKGHKDDRLKEFSPVALKKNKRQSLIIGLLKKKKEIMVGDVSEIIQDCSEKTIQRELLSLVSQGVLKKQGERRWTRYMLV